MKKSVAWVASWALYWIGHVLSQPLRWDWGTFMYPAYNRCMIASSDVQDWGEANGPWGPITSDPMGD